MSLRREPFEAICRGEKQHEFRRRYLLYKRPHSVLIYVPSPVRAIQGVVTFGPTIKDSVSNLALIGKRHNYDGDRNIREYMHGLDNGYALPIVKVHRLVHPLTLKILREIVPGFAPPQSYFKIANRKYYKIMEHLRETNGL